MRAADTPERISSFLLDTLVSTNSLNNFLESAIPEISAVFGASRGILLDYRENTARFDLLHFAGFSEQARFELQHRLKEMDLTKAVEQRQPYLGESNPAMLFLPLYFTETLEAVIVLESDGLIELTHQRLRIAGIVSRFVGLLMSSNRLSINQAGGIDFDDLERAREIQQSYLPAQSLVTDRYEIYGYNQSSALVGGDYFDYFTREKAIQCILADASGHGLSAALIMSSFRASLRSELQRGSEFAGLFSVLNQSVHSGGSIAQYLTGVFFDLDEASGRLRYVNAGHYEPAVVGSDGSTGRLSGGGPPLGMFKNSKYPTGAAKVESGDLLVLFTDGLTDLRNQSDEFFGEERILDSVASNRHAPLREIAKVVLAEGMAFSATPHPEDDLTLLLFRFY